MRITVIATYKGYEVRFFEFIAPSGRTVTSFFQIIKSPNIPLGCFDLLEDAMLRLEDPDLIAANVIEKPLEYFLGEKVVISSDELSAGIIR